MCHAEFRTAVTFEFVWSACLYQPLPFFPSRSLALCAAPPIRRFGVNGVFLYSPGGTISEITAANDTLPGQTQATSFVPDLSVPVNSPGQAAFGAAIGNHFPGVLPAKWRRDAESNCEWRPGPRNKRLLRIPSFHFRPDGQWEPCFHGRHEHGSGRPISCTGWRRDSDPRARRRRRSCSGWRHILAGTGWTDQFQIRRPVLSPLGINLFKEFCGNEWRIGRRFRRVTSRAAARIPATSASCRAARQRALCSQSCLQGQAAPGGGTFNTITVLSNLSWRISRSVLTAPLRL